MIVLAVVVLLPLIGYGILRSPRVQTYLGQRIANYLSRQLDTRVNVGGVNVSFFLNVVLEDMLVEDQHQEQMIFAKRTVIDISRVSFRKRLLIINKISFDQSFIGLTRYNGKKEFNFRFLVDYLMADEPDPEKKRWQIVCNSLEFSRSAFSFQDHNKAPTDFGFDPGHFAVGDFAMAIDGIKLAKDTLSFELNRITFKEAKGFELQYLSGSFLINPQQAQIKNLIVRTPLSDLELQVNFTYEGYQSFEKIFDEVALEVSIDDSKLDLADAGFFIPAAYGIDGPVMLSGNFRGTPANLRGTNISVNYGRSTALKGNFHLMGLPNLRETFINLSLEDMRTSITDLSNFRLPVSARNNYPQVPSNLANLGRISFRGRLTGFVNDMVAFGRLQTDIGVITSDILVRQHLPSGLPSYKGQLITENFNLGKLFEAENQIGLLNLNAEVEGKGITLETVDLAIAGQVKSVELRGYTYNNLEIAGNLSNQKFNGSLLVKDPNLFLDFQGIINLGEAIPVFDFSARFEQANLTRLNVYQRDTLAESLVSGVLTINAVGSDFDNITGQVVLDHLFYEELSLENEIKNQYTTGRIQLIKTIDENQSKMLQLRSDFLDADLTGHFRFYRIGQSVRNLVEVYIPAFYRHLGPAKDNGFYFGNTGFVVQFKETGMLSDLFFPYIRVSSGSGLRGSFGKAAGELEFNAWADTLVLAGNRFSNLHINSQPQNNTFHLDLKSDRLLISDSLFMDQLSFTGQLRNDNLQTRLVWNNPDSRKRNFGNIEGLLQFFDRNRTGLSLLPSLAVINDAAWRTNAGNQVVFDSARVEVRNLMISKNEEYLLVNGLLSQNPEDQMLIEFNEFDVTNLSQLLRLKNMNFEGAISGQLALGSLRDSPRFEADLYVSNFAFNFDHLGDLHFVSHWDNNQKGFHTYLEVVYHGNVGSNRPLRASGYFFPERKDNNFDLDIVAENLKMSIWGRYLESFASNFRGLATGRLRLEGPLNQPELSGRLKLARAGLNINFLNTSYTFTHDLTITKNQFSFENMVINDTFGNSGLVSGRVTHQTFKDFGIDIMLRPERMALLNTSAGQNNVMFYGRAFGSGVAHIFGPVDNITLNMSGRTSRGTQIFLPLDRTDYVAESTFITFVSRDTLRAIAPVQIPQGSNLTLNLDLEVTPDAEIQLIFDSRMGDIIRGRGAGNIKMELPAGGSFRMYGDYTIEEGEYLFTLQNIINKRFRIEQGGVIRWMGDPLDADIDLRAVYRLRTALYDLVQAVDTSEAFRRRIPIETVMILRDKLYNPTISFDIAIPGGDEGTREMLQRIITTEQEMNRQVFSLLVLNRFMPTTTDQYNTALGFGVGSTSSELLSNQLSNWLSQISNEFDIGINYRPGDQISSQELEVALSTQLFNDRVTIDGNVGVAGNAPGLGNQRTSTIIGDVNVEVKLTPEGRFRVKAFNRSNTFDIVNANSPYTQGIGVFFRKEFDNLHELWRRRVRSEGQTGFEQEIPVEDL